jgi:uncharacterized tellurite resistance protein B-like protein
MDKLLNKKINLLLHLALVDGKFQKAEKSVLKSILKENGLEEVYLELHNHQNVQLSDFKGISDKEELLFWILRLIHADGRLHMAEIAYSRVIAKQLGFNEELINHFVGAVPQTLRDFQKEAEPFRIS